MKIDNEILKKWGYHGNYIDLANQTVYWLHEHEKELYRLNMKGTDTKKMLEILGWNDTNITYTFNSDGFRSDDFDQKCHLLTAGCSQTFGHSLDLESTWSKKLCDHYECAHMNVALPGSAWQNVAMGLAYWIPKLKPKIVAIYSPPMHRLGWITPQDSQAGQSGTAHVKEFYKMKVKSKIDGKSLGYTISRPFVDMLSTENTMYNQLSSIEFIKKVCKENSSECLILDRVKFVDMWIKSNIHAGEHFENADKSFFEKLRKISVSNRILKKQEFDLARDLDHNGRIVNVAIFEYFKEQISKIKHYV